MRRLFFVILCLWGALVVFWANDVILKLRAETTRPFPFGIFTSPDGTIYSQDFSYNMLFFKSIEERVVAHPYRLEEQEKLIRHMVPGIPTGLSHAYSPVALVLALPLLAVSGYQAYLIYTILSMGGIVLLFRFYLLPRAECPLQLCALTVCVTSLCLVSAFEIGQSVLLTTTLLGAFWALLQRRAGSFSIPVDLALAVLFWALCLKPSIAIIPLMLLLGARAWRALVIGTALLLATWTFTASYYGGWWTGLQDYAFLLNHYNNQEFPPFMQRGIVDPQAGFLHLTWLQWFWVERDLSLILSLTLLLLRWTKRITASEHFQGMVWAFLLVCPYVLTSEEWILCLLVVEGPFFRTRNWIPACGKLLLLFGVLSVRVAMPFGLDMNFILKCTLFFWILAEGICARRRLTDIGMPLCSGGL